MQEGAWRGGLQEERRFNVSEKILEAFVVRVMEMAYESEKG